MVSYYGLILFVGVANLALAAVAYVQRAKQIRGNKLREQQVALAERRNDLAEERLRRLNEQIVLLAQIRDGLGIPRPPSSFPPVGVVDVGSSTVRLLVAKPTAGALPLARIAGDGVFMRLGAEAERKGAYDARTLERAGVCVRSLVETASAAGCERLAVVITSPGRIGANADALVDAIRTYSGHDPVVVSPADEAQLTFIGAAMTAGVPADEATVVCDVGGGSTEVALGSLSSGVYHAASYGIGSFVLAERHFSNERPEREELEAAEEEARRIIELDFSCSPRRALASGGSARALAKIAGLRVGTEELQDALTAAMSTELLRVKNKHRRRALPAVIVILSVLQSKLGMPLTIAKGGMREGVLLCLSGLASTWIPLTAQPVSASQSSVATLS